jgi:hypothetical protein
MELDLSPSLLGLRDQFVLIFLDESTFGPVDFTSPLPRVTALPRCRGLWTARSSRVVFSLLILLILTISPNHSFEHIFSPSFFPLVSNKDET